jgi:hypothetical protein
MLNQADLADGAAEIVHLDRDHRDSWVIAPRM